MEDVAEIFFKMTKLCIETIDHAPQQSITLLNELSDEKPLVKHVNSYSKLNKLKEKAQELKIEKVPKKLMMDKV